MRGFASNSSRNHQAAVCAARSFCGERQLVGGRLLIVAIEHEEGDQRFRLRKFEAIPFGGHRPARAGMRGGIGQLRLGFAGGLDVVIVVAEQRIARAGKGRRRIGLLELRAPARAIHPAVELPVEIVAQQEQRGAG